MQIDANNVKVIIKADGAAGAGQVLKEAVGDLKLTGTEWQAVRKAARLQNGKLDPKAADGVEHLAKQMAALAKSMRKTVTAESRPSTDAKDFQTPPDKLGKTACDAAIATVRQFVTMSMSEGATVLGGKQNADGTDSILIATHHFASGPTADSPKYVVTLNEQGTPTHILIPSEAVARPIPGHMSTATELW